MSVNPYAPPQSLDSPLASSAEFVDLRKKHISHEASLRSVGVLYWLGAFFLMLAGVMALFDTGEDLPVRLAIGLALMGVGVLYFWVGSGLRKLRRSARLPTGILSGIGLLGIPFGTIINGYILYLVVSKKGAMVFSDQYKEIMAATPDIKYRTSIIVWIFLAIVILGLVALAFAMVFQK